MKIIIFEGTFKTTTFINRLIEGLSVRHEIYVLGFNETFKKKLPKVTYLGLGSNNSRMVFVKRSIQIRGMNLLLQLRLFFDLIKRDRKKIVNSNIQLAVDRIQPDIIHFQWPSVLSYLEMLNLPCQTRIVLSQRGFQINVRPFVDDQNMRFLKEIFPKVNGFHSVSKAIRAQSNKIYTSTSKIDKVIYSGFDLKDLMVKKTNIFSKVLKLISIGRNHWIKDYRTAIGAVCLLKQKGIPFHYTLVGVEKDEELLFLVSQSGLQNDITFLNSMNQRDVYRKMTESDLLLLSSIQEGIANVCIEAMFCKLPVLSTDCGGMSELIEDGLTGFLTPTRSPDLMAKKIAQILQIKNHRMAQITKKAREKVIEQHSKKKMLTEMELLYKKVCQIC